MIIAWPELDFWDQYQYWDLFVYISHKYIFLNINSLDTNTLDFIQDSSRTMNGNISLSASWETFFPQIQGGNPSRI